MGFPSYQREGDKETKRDRERLKETDRYRESGREERGTRLYLVNEISETVIGLSIIPKRERQLETEKREGRDCT